ncbi:hypothetical protein QQ008_00755 [Fulvivirgaceae bacterium BMA10]|uniref:Uncharacterized protein n=1 Tax=Splendidivirga corallicola TaxID=3051826 RepID=A0ABT8KHY5_9BACT|nr:hypothetical protein [Fulvivirgaceae bacterium BMA10]
MGLRQQVFFFIPSIAIMLISYQGYPMATRYLRYKKEELTKWGGDYWHVIME